MQEHNFPKKEATSLTPYLTSRTDVGLYYKKVQQCNDNDHLALTVHRLWLHITQPDFK